MSEEILCLDTTVFIKALTAEEPEDEEHAAKQLVLRGVLAGRMVAPAWAWAEVGSVLRKKIRAGLVEVAEGRRLWTAFLKLPIDFLDTWALRMRAWELAEQYTLPTLYDATFLACTELAPGPASARREFWTADAVLLRQLGR